MSTALGFSLQAIAQQHLPPSNAAIILHRRGCLPPLAAPSCSTSASPPRLLRCRTDLRRDRDRRIGAAARKRHPGCHPRSPSVSPAPHASDPSSQRVPGTTRFPFCRPRRMTPPALGCLGQPFFLGGMPPLSCTAARLATQRPHNGQALFLLRRNERRQVDAAAAGVLQLPRARHAHPSVHLRALCRRRRRQDPLAPRRRVRGRTVFRRPTTCSIASARKRGNRRTLRLPR